MTHNHGCAITWCTNQAATSKAQRLEHFGRGWYGAATGNAVQRTAASALHEALMTVGVGLRFNEDADVAPLLYVHLLGGPDNTDADAILQLNEAILLHRVLGDQLRAALADRKLDPDRVIDLAGL